MKRGAPLEEEASTDYAGQPVLVDRLRDPRRFQYLCRLFTQPRLVAKGACLWRPVCHVLHTGAALEDGRYTYWPWLMGVILTCSSEGKPLDIAPLLGTP